MRTYSGQDSRLAMACRSSGRAGMTLLEVMMCIALLIPMLLGFSYMALGSAQLNRKTEMVVAGTNAISAKMATIAAAASDNWITADGSNAKGFVKYLRDLRDVSDSPSVSGNVPYRITWHNSEGILVYEFAVAHPGAKVGDATFVDASLESAQYDLARGVMYVYLREDAVPADFYTWSDLQLSGGSETLAANGKTFFDMNGDGKGNGDFANLLTGSSYSDLMSLPVSVSVMYYPSKKYFEQARDLPVGPGNYPDTGYSTVSVTRNYIINNSSVLGLGFYD